MLNDIHILITDDEPKNIQILASVLKEQGYHILVASNGKDAVSIAEKNLPDLILMDIVMPELDGLSACKNLKTNSLTKDIPVIFITAKHETEDIVKGFEVGGVDYIGKPFNRHELIARVNNQISLVKSQKNQKKVNEELSILLQEKDVFFSILGHDLKNPVYAQISFMEYLLSNFHKLTTDDIMKNLEYVLVSSKSMASLLESILQWSKVKQGKIDINPISIDLKYIVKEVLEVITLQANRKNITIFDEIQERHFIYADINSLMTVLRNFLTNAIKFTHENGKIVLKVEVMPEKRIKVIVEDNGVGIREERKHKMMSLSYSNKSEGTNHETGSGLGLILCKELLLKNNAEIGFVSEFGKGSQFFFIINECDNTGCDF